MSRKRIAPANRKGGIALKHFLPMAQICVKNKDEPCYFNFKALIETLEAEALKVEAEQSAAEREARLGRLLTEALAELLLAYGDCAHVPSGGRDKSCKSCQVMARCDMMWKELRTDE